MCVWCWGGGGGGGQLAVTGWPFPADPVTWPLTALPTDSTEGEAPLSRDWPEVTPGPVSGGRLTRHITRPNVALTLLKGERSARVSPGHSTQCSSSITSQHTEGVETDANELEAGGRGGGGGGVGFIYATQTDKHLTFTYTGARMRERARTHTHTHTHGGHPGWEAGRRDNVPWQ